MKMKRSNNFFRAICRPWWPSLFIIFLGGSGWANNYYQSDEFKNNVYFQVHALTASVNTAGHLKNEYNHQALLIKIRQLLALDNATLFAFKQNLRALWQTLPELKKDSSLPQWCQANIDRFIIVTAFELINRAESIELSETFFQSLSSGSRRPLILQWKEIDKNLWGRLEVEAHAAFQHWKEEPDAGPIHFKDGCKSGYILAHRGGHSGCPENSLAAFRKALAFHSDGLECDLRLSRDGAVFVLHDNELERVTGKKLDLHTLTRAQVLALNLLDPLNPTQPSKERPLLLEQLLVDCGEEPILWLELKPDESLPLAEKVGDLLERYNRVEKTIVSSFSSGLLAPLRNRFPSLAIAYEFSSLDDVDLSVFLEAPDRHRLIISADHIATQSPGKLSIIQKAGLRTSGFTLNRFDAIKTALEQGVTYIQTDNPRRSRFLRSLYECPHSSRHLSDPKN